MSRRRWVALVGAAATVAALAAVQAPAHAAAPAAAARGTTQDVNRSDNLPNPQADKLNAQRQDAIQKLLTGQATTEVRGGERVIKVPAKSAAGKAAYVRYPVERQETVFTILADFGDTIGPYGGTAGPVHNQIPEPDRVMDGGATDDNSTYWLPDFNQAHYQRMVTGSSGSMKNFYAKQSSGRFKLSGTVTDWVTLPYNEATYGSNSAAQTDTYWPFVRDTANAWYDAMVAKGWSQARITKYLQKFDKVDRYDHDHDGIYNEPDGYIDHFQAIHAGEGEEAGGGAQGLDAIWSHRWKAYQDLVGTAGPAGNLDGGTQIGSSGIWVADYTTEPENGGLGVFAHEFGHDLGLPDLYDTAGGDNGTGFWTLMSAGSWLNPGGEAIGTSPGYMGAWEKLQLGWLDVAVVPYGSDQVVTLGPADRDGRTTPQAIAVPLPDGQVTTSYNTPYSGSYEWWSGTGNYRNATLSRTVDLTAATESATIGMQAWYDTEAGYDYFYGEVSTDGGSQWTQVGPARDGTSAGWELVQYDLTPYVGSSIQFRVRYSSDGAVNGKGVFLDDFTLSTDDGTVAVFDDVESGDNGWTASGFSRMTGSTTRTFPRMYLAENRVYSGYDANLQTGPYQFGWGTTQPDRVERFPYQNGLLVSYMNYLYSDNNTMTHPGGGLILQVDARPTPVVFPGGFLLGNRRQPFDATFGQEATDAVTFHRNGVAVDLPSQPAKPTFDDGDVNRYWSAANPRGSVQVAGSGTRLSVVKTSADKSQLTVAVTFSPAAREAAAAQR